jgi:hypothetical protein
MVQTSPIMLSYLLWYEESASYLGKSGRNIYNATAAGALIPGFNHRTLTELRENIPPLDEDLEAVLKAMDRLPRTSASFLLESVVKTRIDTQAVLEELNKNGLESARALAGGTSPASAALEDIPAGGDSIFAQRQLERMVLTLTKAGKNLHSLAASPG